jgi:energy-coupling factor transporter ATP-binding protein EcfA2
MFVFSQQTRVLVTHSLTHLPEVDYIICIKDGQISEMGSYSDLINHNGAFAELIKVIIMPEMLHVEIWLASSNNTYRQQKV